MFVNNLSACFLQQLEFNIENNRMEGTDWNSSSKQRP